MPRAGIKFVIRMIPLNDDLCIGPVDALSWQYDVADLTTWRMTQLRTSAGVLRGTFVAVIKPSSLGGSESSCISKCVGRNIEATGIVSKALFNAAAKRVIVVSDGVQGESVGDLGRALPDEDFHQAVVLVFANKQDAMAPAGVTNKDDEYPCCPGELRKRHPAIPYRDGVEEIRHARSARESRTAEEHDIGIAVICSNLHSFCEAADFMEQPGLSQETYERLRECCIFKPVFASPRGYRVHHAGEWRRHCISKIIRCKSAVNIIAGKTWPERRSSREESRINRSLRLTCTCESAQNYIVQVCAARVSKTVHVVDRDEHFANPQYELTMDKQRLGALCDCCRGKPFFGLECNYWTERILWSKGDLWCADFVMSYLCKSPEMVDRIISGDVPLHGQPFTELFPDARFYKRFKKRKSNAGPIFEKLRGRPVFAPDIDDEDGEELTREWVEAGTEFVLADLGSSNQWQRSAGWPKPAHAMLLQRRDALGEACFCGERDVWAGMVPEWLVWMTDEEYLERVRAAAYPLAVLVVPDGYYGCRMYYNAKHCGVIGGMLSGLLDCTDHDCVCAILNRGNDRFIPRWVE
ncbi:hypothetical protein SELMODRAFT_422413 [Selaginella moellendorffii]|uniref:Uncharacterized protein n=1 Tax=Selaginella moellendorffii TaxID=88036 RepID=D8SIB4_SELML|nr:hypothetical protein SELMODRAFT_422413 [Selaginella moellendorffii]